MRRRTWPPIGRPWNYRQVASAWDPDALAFLSATSIPSDATVLFTGTAQEITGLEIWNALNQFVLDLKSATLWDAIYALHPIIGGNATAHSKNLKNPASEIMSFVGSPTHDGTGVLFNGTTQSTAVTHTHPDSANVGFGAYTRNAPAGYYIDGDSGKMWLTDAYLKVYSGTQNPMSAYFGTGLVSIFRDNSTQQKFKRNKGSVYTGTASLNNLPTAYDYRHSNRTTRAAFNLALSYKSRALSDAELNSLYDAVQAFQTKLKRQV